MKCGPDECPIVAFSDLTPAEQRERRKPEAERLYKNGFTIVQIAKLFGVSKSTISTDLADFPVSGKSKRAKTESNPRGSGRKRGSKKPGVKQAQRSVDATPEEWESFRARAEEEGSSAAAKLGELIREPEITRDMLSLTAQQKLDAAMRQHQRRLDEAFESRVQEEINQRLDHIILPVWRKKIADAKKIYDVRRSITDKETFNLIVKCLHTDTRRHLSDEIVNEAFVRFMDLEKYLLNEKNSPTKFPGLPATAAEWEQRKQEAAEIRRAKRGQGNVGRVRA